MLGNIFKIFVGVYICFLGFGVWGFMGFTYKKDVGGGLYVNR